MPRRTNLFQRTITIVHEHLAGDATVEESAMMRDRVTGSPTEVDVVVRSEVAGYEVVVAVEARASARPADRNWVQLQCARHADLATNRLVLVSESGFSADARKLAEQKGAVAVAPEDLAGDHPGRRIIEELAAIPLQTVTLSIEHVVMKAHRPGGKPIHVRVPHAMNVYGEDGAYLSMVVSLYRAAREAHSAEFHKDVAPPGGHLEVRMTPSWELPGGEKVDAIYARWDGADPPELQRIEELAVLAKLEVKEEQPIEMQAGQLGDTAYSYGEGTVAGERAVFVLTADATGGRLTMRRLDS